MDILRTTSESERGWTLIETTLVLLIIGLVCAMAIPQFMLFRQDARTFGDARDLADMMMLAKLRAAADFTRARVYADTIGQSFHLETWNKISGSWVTEGGINPLSPGNSFSFGSLGTPPAGTQTVIAEASACQSIAGGSGTISNTACVVFNSRGMPIDSTGSPTSNGALYMTDSSTVYVTTVSVTGNMQLWRSDAVAALWTKR